MPEIQVTQGRTSTPSTIKKNNQKTKNTLPSNQMGVGIQIKF